FLPWHNLHLFRGHYTLRLTYVLNLLLTYVLSFSTYRCAEPAPSARTRSYNNAKRSEMPEGQFTTAGQFMPKGNSRRQAIHAPKAPTPTSGCNDELTLRVMNCAASRA
ncbi:MAG: hypothetical protein IJM45_05595, partial [Clostridia bacterium]|nr:hypothetical protein [Clostridia bacterium]